MIVCNVSCSASVLKAMAFMPFGFWTSLAKSAAVTSAHLLPHVAMQDARVV